MQFIDANDILKATNGGLDIITDLYPDAIESIDQPNRKFKTREEKTASAKLNRTTEGIYLVIDFGNDQTNRNGIHCYAYENKIDYVTALTELAAKIGISGSNTEISKIRAAYSDRDAAAEEEEGTWKFDLIRTGYTDFEIETLVSTQILKSTGWNDEKKRKDAYSKIAGRLKYYHWHPVTSYSIVKDRKVMTFASTDEYPIFLIDEGTHKKVYQPKHADKSKRFMYAPGTGKKPKDFIHGLTQLTKTYEENRDRIDQELQESGDDDGKKGRKKKPNYKLSEVILCTGGSDAINVTLAGYHVIWLNSESAKLTQYQYDQIARMVEKIYQLSDLDATGRKQAHLLAMEYLDIFNIELPEKLLTYKDRRLNPCKDVRDYFNHFKIKDFDLLVSTAIPYRFWEKKANYNRSGEFQGFDYVFDNEQGYNFLQKNGFYRLPMGDKKTDFDFIQIDGNTVKYSGALEIKEFIKNFMRDRYLDKDLRNSIYRSAQLNDSSLANLDKIDISFDDNDKNTQYLFFLNKTLEVTAKGITEHKPGAIRRFIWEDEVYQHRYEKLDNEPFTITKDSLGTYDIKISNSDCLFLKYLIQTSRMHWRAELEERLPTSDLTPTERDQYLIDNQYNIAGPLCTPEEIEEQKRHLVNKIFSIGFLMHRYKDRSKPWFIFAMDGKLSEDGQSHGGSGKSLLYDMAMRTLLKRNFMLSGRNPKLTDDAFRYDGLNEYHRYIFVEDAHEYLRLDVFYTDISGDMKVNPKGKSPFTIPFEKTGKFSFTSNYTPKNIGPSTLRRLIYNVFSDYYHSGETTDYKESRDPRTEFGKNMFTEFNQTDFNNFYNTAAYCLRFYLSATEKIGPAMSNVNTRNLLTIMGDNFKDWANAYFSEEGDKLDRKIVRDVAFKDFTFNNSGNKWTPQSFWTRLEAFCKLNGYILNPKHLLNKKGKIIEKVEDAYYDQKTNTWTDTLKPKVTKELIYIQTLDEVPGEVNFDNTPPDIQFTPEQTEFPI
ncbi:hypothetical protein [Pedobacter antarcticus]|uniref:primase-helicase family protein n=1 Tax=Pedobacter antarcticus TaxID=34086 RepID=UPI0029318D24|nr:hypothetical protein [Pedobacter antarcticus]